MSTFTRLAVLLASALLVFAVACGGDSGTPEDDVRRDVTNALNALIGDEPDLPEFAKYAPNECPLDVAELALGLAFLQAFLGDADLEFEVSEVEFPSEDRALATLTGSGEFLESFGGGADEADLWAPARRTLAQHQRLRDVRSGARSAGAQHDH